MSTFIVSYGGGVTSAEALKRVIDRHGRKSTVAVFADMGQVRDSEGRVVDGEDDDLYRFMAQVEEFLDFKIIRLRNKRGENGIWQGAFRHRCIPNRLIDHCSRQGKREVLDSFLNGNFMPLAGDTSVTGLDWSEPKRLRDFEAAMQPWKVAFPLCDEPRRTKAQLILKWIGHGIEPPRLYEEGFSHNNCSGFCVKSGVWMLWNLWIKRPWIYLYHERQEARFRRAINATATVFKGFTLAEMRARFEGGYLPLKRGGGCRGQCVMPVKGEFAEMLAQ